MISLIIPYWDRQDFLDANLARMKLLYPKYDMEVIIINDGWKGGYIVKDTYPWSVRIYNMPEKEEPKNPCVPLNKGVSLAKGNIVILTNPEVIQRKAVIGPLKEELEKLGPQGYAAAATWHVDDSKWICHSSFRTKIPVPRCAGSHFFSMMYKAFFKKVQFDERYREGQTFEDSDFLWRLWEAEAKFKVCDDLVVNRHRIGTRWPNGGYERNEEIFKKKWLPITVGARA